MATPKRINSNGPVPFSIDPGMIPDDGSSVTFEQTFAKRLGPANGTQNLLADEDYEHKDWQLEYQLPNGKWAVVGVVKGRPYPHTLLNRDPGNYRATPIGSDYKPVEAKAITMVIGTPVQQAPMPVPQYDAPPRQEDPSGAMPAWMQVLFQREAEERAEARRRADEDARRREKWEREQMLKEEARKERDERLAELRAEREAQARKEAADRTNALIMAGMQLAQQAASAMVTAATSKNQSAPARDDRMQELLISHILSERKQAAVSPSPNGSLRESLDLLLALDGVAQARADRLPPPPAEKDEEDSVSSSMIKMLPMLVGGLAGGGGGGGQQAPAVPNVEALLTHALRDPKVIAQIAARDPEGMARTFSKVVKSDKRLEQAVVKVLEEDAAEEGDE